MPRGIQAAATLTPSAMRLCWLHKLCFWRNFYETIIACSADSGFCLRHRERAGIVINSSTYINSTRQRHHQRLDLGLAGEPSGGLGQTEIKQIGRAHV